MRKTFISIITAFGLNAIALDATQIANTSSFVPTATSSGVGAVGTIITASNNICPPGSLNANGQSITLANYPQLHAMVGNNVPDLRGEFIRGWDEGRGIDRGRRLGSSQGDAIRNILAGSIGNSDVNNHVPPTGAAFISSTFHRGSDHSGGGRVINFDASRVVPTATENRPRNIAMLYCIVSG